MYKSLPTKPCKLEVESPREAATITTADFVERVLNQREQECPSRRKESAELILAVCCGSIGLPLSRNQSLSKRVCRPCGPKILNTAELFKQGSRLRKIKPNERFLQLSRRNQATQKYCSTTVNFLRAFPGLILVILRTQNSISNNETATTTAQIF